MTQTRQVDTQDLEMEAQGRPTELARLWLDHRTIIVKVAATEADTRHARVLEVACIDTEGLVLLDSLSTRNSTIQSARGAIPSVQDPLALGRSPMQSDGLLPALPAFGTGGSGPGSLVPPTFSRRISTSHWTQCPGSQPRLGHPVCKRPSPGSNKMRSRLVTLAERLPDPDHSHQLMPFLRRRPDPEFLTHCIVTSHQLQSLSISTTGPPTEEPSGTWPGWVLGHPRLLELNER